MVNTSVPTKNQCMKILRKYNTPNSVIQHCLTVTEIVEDFCSKIPSINKDIAIAGAMLHDIGRSVDHSIFHAVNGVRILENENIDYRIISIVKNHIGTGITKEEAVKLGLPVQNYIPKTIEEEIVSYADNLTDGGIKRSFEEILDYFIQKFGKESHVVKGLYRQKELINKLMLENKMVRKE